MQPPALRRQATLYLPETLSATIESIRAEYNPAQFSLIRAHVTLCREDEVDDWEAFEDRARQLRAIEVTLNFEMPIRIGDSVYLPCVEPTAAFNELRSELLLKPLFALRSQSPHLTLIHPRNGQCSDSIFVDIQSRCRPFACTFDQVTLIEQVNGSRWTDLATFGETD